MYHAEKARLTKIAGENNSIKDNSVYYVVGSKKSILEYFDDVVHDGKVYRLEFFCCNDTDNSIEYYALQMWEGREIENMSSILEPFTHLE